MKTYVKNTEVIIFIATQQKNKSNTMLYMSVFHVLGVIALAISIAYVIYLWVKDGDPDETKKHKPPNPLKPKHSDLPGVKVTENVD